MKKILGLIGTFFLFVILALVAVGVMAQYGLGKKLLVAGTRASTGLDLQINGPMTLRLVPSLDMHMENVVLANPVDSKPVLTARVVEFNAGYLAAFGASHTLGRIKLVDPSIEVETDKNGRHSWQPPSPAPTRDTSARSARTFAVTEIEMTGGTVSYRDQRTGLVVRLDKADATLRNVNQERLGEALVKAGAITYSEPGSGTNLEVADLDAKASVVDITRIGAIAASGSRLRWRDKAQPAGIETAKFTATAEALGFDGSGPVALNSSTLSWRDPAGGATLNASSFEAAAKSLRGGRLADVTFKSGTMAFAHPANGTINVSGLAGTAKGARVEALDDVAFSGSSLAFAHPTSGKLTANAVGGGAKTATLEALGEATFKSGALVYEHASTGTINASNVAAAAMTATAARLEGVTFVSSALGTGQATRAAGAASPFDLQQVSIAAPVLAFGAPVVADVAFVHNKERVAGSVKLPSPESIAAGPVIPANVSLKADRGSIDFDGRIETGATTAFKGSTRATTTSVEALAGWLGVSVPATLQGPVTLSGLLDAQGSRASLSNGRIEHGANTMSGTFAFDGSGARPKISGRIAADRLDADAYLGLPPVKPRPRPQAGQPRPPSTWQPETIEPEVNLADVFKSYVRAALDAPPRRSGAGGPIEFPELKDKDLVPAATRAKPKPGAFTWSESKIDFSALRAFDLDVDWSVKSLLVRGVELSAPQLKTHLDNGAFTLEGRDIGTGDGRISGKAQIDARQSMPTVSATVRGSGVDIEAISDALGIPPMIDGSTSIEADVKASGTSQKQLVQSLSGKVKTEMPQGDVVGIDLGSVNVFTIGKLFSGAPRQYDPGKRTPISGLKAELDIDKGIVRESQVSVGGPILGVMAEGTIELAEQRLDYSGRARISSAILNLFTVAFRYFGDWSRPALTTDVNLGGSVFGRDPAAAASMRQLIDAAEIKPDAELALLIGRLMQRAGPTGLDPGTSAMLLAVQKKALGN